jgi:hypothetical protein
MGSIPMISALPWTGRSFCAYRHWCDSCCADSRAALASPGCPLTHHSCAGPKDRNRAANATLPALEAPTGRGMAGRACQFVIILQHSFAILRYPLGVLHMIIKAMSVRERGSISC